MIDVEKQLYYFTVVVEKTEKGKFLNFEILNIGDVTSDAESCVDYINKSYKDEGKVVKILGVKYFDTKVDFLEFITSNNNHNNKTLFNNINLFKPKKT